jgi:hypothetical protein
MRTNSIISDPEPTQPVIPALSGQKKPKPTDYEKIANSEEYPQFAHYINSRIEHYQRYTPGGKAIEGLSKKQRVEAWDSAVVIIKELEGLMNTVNAFKRNKDEVQSS